MPFPPWAEGMLVTPTDPPSQLSPPLQAQEFEPGFGGLPLFSQPTLGPSSGLTVNLALGEELYAPRPDLVMTNGTGSDALFARSWRSAQARAGYGSPGLAAGWVHNLDIRIKRVGKVFQLHYPTGVVETLTPKLGSDGKLTGELETLPERPYFAQGIPGQGARWESLTLRWRNTVWTFTPLSEDLYVLTELGDLQLRYDTNRRLSSVWPTSPIPSPNTKEALLTFTYDAKTGHLAQSTDRRGRFVTYTFERDKLMGVSALTGPGQKPSPFYQYGYILESGSLVLCGITIPSPSGEGTAIARIAYEKGRVKAHIDANGNKRLYTYRPDGVAVEVLNKEGVRDGYWIINIDERGHHVGKTDANGNRIYTYSYK